MPLLINGKLKFRRQIVSTGTKKAFAVQPRCFSRSGTEVVRRQPAKP
jgi:hypothetical protein